MIRAWPSIAVSTLLAAGLWNGAPAAQAGVVESFWTTLAGDFEDPVNWSGPVPDETVTAIFDVDAETCPCVRFNNDAACDRLLARAGEVHFYLWDQQPTGDYLSLVYDALSSTIGSPSVVVAENPGDQATLKIYSGFLNGSSVVLGLAPESAGSISFGDTFDLPPGLACQSQLHVGSQGEGLLTIAQHASVTASAATAGVNDGSFGQIVVTEPGSRLDVDNELIVGKQGHGVMTVDGLADVTSGGAIIGQSPGTGQGEVLMTGQGSTWNINGSLDVGFEGQGSLSVAGGAAVFTNGFAVIGSFPEPGQIPMTGGTGNVTVSGPVSLWLVEGDLFVGLAWSGTLDVLDGATVTSSNGAVGMFGNQFSAPPSQATVEGVGSAWGVIGEVDVFDGGTLKVADGGLVIASLVDLVSDTAELEGDGTIIADADNSGTIRVGNPVGPLAIEGDLIHSYSGKLLIDLGGTAPGSFDALEVTGDVTLLGDLTATLTGGYVPRAGDAFEILTADAITGAFDAVTLPELAPPLLWLVNQDGDSVVLVVSKPGDLNGDGAVSTADFLMLLSAWGPCPAFPAACPADLDGNGTVSTADLLILLANWG